MTKIESDIKDIESMLSMLEPEQIAQLMGGITINNRIHKIDYSRKLRRIRINDLYFSAEPKPHQIIDGSVMTPEEYRGHRQGVWEQIMSGVDL